MAETLEDVPALVTGGGSGIGRATALALAARGARVLVADIADDRAARTAAEIADAGGTADSAGTDVTDPDAVLRLVDAAVDRWGGLVVAVNNAGTSGRMARTADVDLDAWRATMSLNLDAVFYCLRAEIPAMIASGGGSIVNLSSGAGLRGFPGLPAYVASKHGVIGLTRASAMEYARKGIRINAVCPGSTRTPMLEDFTDHDESALAGMGSVTPMGRLGTPDEIAAAIVWLCSPDASFVTGHALSVDGGALA
jgi:NAD(P)-dependent dehydrogenase (short-subunit alcohol dehydrogenase family)